MNKKLLSTLPEHDSPTDILPVKYVIKSSINQIENVRVLFISFFSQTKEKKKGDKNKATFKVFIWDNQYISQKLQDDGSYKWSNACINNLTGYWSYNMMKAGCEFSYDKENIESFLNVKCKPGEEITFLARFQDNIMQRKLNEKHEKIKLRIDEVMDNVSPLPKDFDDWVYNGPLGFSRYIYYKREGRKILAFCTECKKEFAIFESKNTRKKVKHNHSGTCPQCNKQIEYKAIGKTKNHWDSANFAIMQKFEDGLIVRYFYGSKSYREHYKHPALRYIEEARVIYNVSNKVLNYKKYEFANFCQTNSTRWCDDSGKVGTHKAYLYTRNLKEITKETPWKYSCLYEFVKKVNILNIGDFLAEYLKHPTIEYFIKLKLFRFVNDKLSNSYRPSWSGVDFKGKNIKEVLGIEKPLLIQIQRLNLGSKGFDLIKEAFCKGKTLDDQQVKWVLNNLEIHSYFLNMLSFTTPHKIINYILKQSNSKYSPSNVISDWCDYLTQCKELKFDTTNTFILFPKNLIEKHEEYTLLTKAKGLEKYNAKVKKAYQALDNHYTFSDKSFLIRPASSVDEIVKEGHILRHCVAGRSYVEGVSKGDRAIMFIRKIDAPDIPLFTLELNLSDSRGNLSIFQCRGYQNSNMTDDVNKFVDKWKAQKLTQKKAKTRITVPA